MLELIDIVYSYDEKPLLNGVSFKLEDNEVLSLLGPSGSGKSTILRIIAGFETPVSGSVLYNGRNIMNDPVYKRNFGMVFQDYALFPHMNVYENIAFGLRLKKLTGVELDKTIKSALKQVGMESFSERRVTELSGGEQQRVALARTLVVKPSIIMLDEPLGALDYSLRQSLIEELKSLLGRNGLSAIYVTHDQNEALSLSDKIAILHEGRILQIDSPEKLYARPADKWCANFLGFHNFVRNRIIESDGLYICNFDEKVKIGSFDSPTGTIPEILLKDGKISFERPDTVLDFSLTAIPEKSIYRGDYYDIELKINDMDSVKMKSKTKLSLGQPVQIFYQKDDYILY